MQITLQHYLFISLFLFVTGIYISITKKNAIMILIGIELILNAANLNLVAFSKFDADQMQGQTFALFVILIAACEAAVALAIVLKAYDYFKTVHLNEINNLKY